LENEKLRSELANLQQTIEVMLQTGDVPNAAPVPNIVEVEVFRPAHCEERLCTRVDRLTNLVQALQMHNEYLQSLVRKSSSGSGGSVASSTATVPMSVWEKHRSKILMGGAIVILAGTAAYFYWPVVYKGGVRIAQMVFENGTAAEIWIVPAPKPKVAENTTFSLAGSIDAAVSGMLQVSQNGVGIPEDY
jgi:hypothetical protein